jgi:NCS1 family nucleobase:cation symporter-1
LRIDDLYRRGGIYEYRNGVNPRALISLGVGVIVALAGVVVPGMRWVYDYAWFAGFGLSGAVYVKLMQGTEKG